MVVRSLPQAGAIGKINIFEAARPRPGLRRPGAPVEKERAGPDAPGGIIRFGLELQLKINHGVNQNGNF
jgi:hypothetical protein